jgi:hypothetical protein
MTRPALTFGSRDYAGMWCLRPTGQLPAFQAPADVARQSGEGLQRALELLTAVAA